MGIFVGFCKKWTDEKMMKKAETKSHSGPELEMFLFTFWPLTPNFQGYCCCLSPAIRYTLYVLDERAVDWEAHTTFFFSSNKTVIQKLPLLHCLPPVL